MTFKEYIKEEPIDKDITALNLNELNLTDLNGIEEYKEIEHLFLNRNKIKDITPLSDYLRNDTLIEFKNIIRYQRRKRIINLL